MFDNFCKYCILQGAEIFPLNVSAEDSKHLGICNPSIFDDGDKVYLTLRNVNYMIYDNKDKSLQTPYGEFVYTTTDAEDTLNTRNYLCEYDINENKILSYKLIDTSDFDIKPVWQFIGHEDVRIVRWDGKLYVSGCRRDVKENGESRMELCEIDPITGKELSRLRIKAPGDNTSYCEKNWVPVLDKPFHYVKWTNPTELVKVNPETGDCESLFVKDQDQSKINTFRALRGSSQVIPYKDGYIALMHEVDLWLNDLNRKEATYFMKWVIFDKEFNITQTSDEFNFLDFSIEFTNGLMYKDGIFYIPFAVMDTISFMLKVPEQIVMNFIERNKEASYYNIIQKDDIYKKLCIDGDNKAWFEYGEILHSEKQYIQAATCYLRSLNNGCTSVDEKYKYAYSLAKAFSGVGERDSIELSLWENCVLVDSSRSEAYENLARYYRWRGKDHTAYLYAKLAYEYNNYKETTITADVDSIMSEIYYYELSYYFGNKVEAYTNLINLKNHLISSGDFTYYIQRIDNILNTINNNKKNIKKII